MKKLLFAAAGLAMLSLPATGAAQELRLLELWIGDEIFESPSELGGEFCDSISCTGELVTCPAGAGIDVLPGVYSFLDGICDDHDPSATPCAGRFTFYAESCFDPATDQITAGSITYFQARGEFRICFDDSAIGDCTGFAPAGVVIAEVDSRSQSRGDANNPATSWGEAVSTPIVTTSFTDPTDGAVKEYNEAPSISYFTSQGTGCDLTSSNPCGVAGTTFIVTGGPPKKKK